MGGRSLLSTNGIISLTTVIQSLIMGHTLSQSVQLSVITGRWVSGSNLIACKIREKGKGSMGVLHYGNYPYSIGGSQSAFKGRESQCGNCDGKDVAHKSLGFNVKNYLLKNPTGGEKLYI